MACGGCGSGRKQSVRSVRRSANGSTRRRSAQDHPVVFSERSHGGYQLQVSAESDADFGKGREDGEPKYAE